MVHGRRWCGGCHPGIPERHSQGSAMSIKERLKSAALKLRMWALAAVAAIGGVFGYHHIAESQATPVTDTLTWTMPPQYMDGTALPISQIAKTTIVWGTAQGGPYAAGT